jgi:hypothetical protein
MGRWQNPRRSAGSAPLRLGNVVDRDADDGARTTRLITIESLRRGQLRRFHAATFLLPLPRRFHERNFGPKSAQQKAIENDVFSMAYDLVARTGFEPVTFRLL